MVRPEDIELSIPLDSLCFVVIKARQLMVKEGNILPESSSNPTDDGMAEVLETTPDDPVRQELASFIEAMDEDERVDLVTLVWVGRGDYELADWEAAREEAARSHDDGTARYLLGLPLLADHLEDALSALGRSCEDTEAQHL